MNGRADDDDGIWYTLAFDTGAQTVNETKRYSRNIVYSGGVDQGTHRPRSMHCEMARLRDSRYPRYSHSSVALMRICLAGLIKSNRNVIGPIGPIGLGEVPNAIPSHFLNRKRKTSLAGLRHRRRHTSEMHIFNV